ncbi:complement C4-B-like [Archocentrus centrarchus]|uniref:complement C4-B-like n=1 Tax=Archocentrus centrarchus TaxID=63155 RepID=UPI0011E9DAF7|nr:complement C4-B-like [Archocentrus centrarchus]
MKCHMFLILLLIWTVECSTGNRFIISAPKVFHVGVNERVFVQMGGHHLNNPVSLYLEHETSNIALSEKKTVTCTEEEKTKTVKLKLNKEILFRLPQTTYVMLVAESQSFATSSKRQSTRVLVSHHRGYIFIQTDQPIYNPTQKVKYRIFTLDHTMRPCQEPIQISVINAAGNRILKIMKIARGGILQDLFAIPDVSEMGTWNITAHYNGDEENAAFREFKVQKFVLPSFDVNIAMGKRYILMNDEELRFTISAMYTYGEKVKGAYYCQFGVVKKDGSGGQEMTFIKGLAMTGSVQDGNANASLRLDEINLRLQRQLNKTLSDVQKHGERLLLRVFVTNIRSGEIQEAEVYLRIFSHKYTIDLSRTRSHFIPGYPLDVVVLVRLPDGSPADGVSVNINIPASSLSWKGTTDQEGALFNTFNIVADADITVEVSSNDVQERKIIQRASSQHGSYLYMTFTSRIYSVNDLLTITFNTMNIPTSGSLHYMVLSRGSLIKEGSLQLGITVKHNLLITPDMVPSFRVIGYYHNANDQLIADSVWVDVRDKCELNVKVQLKGPFEPKANSKIEFDLQGHRAKVALLAVDKAFYALNADNKLTAKQVFSTMNSYDLGCSYGGGSDSASVLLDAGLAAVSNDLTLWKRELGCNSPSVRHRRSVDLEQEMMTLKLNYTEKNLQDCCVHGFSRIPMERTCRERADRVLLVKKDQTCADVFLKCCLEAERLRQEKMELQKGFGRTATAADIEEFFLDTSQYIRRYFPPSFEFVAFEVTGKKIHSLFLPDSITTWELQVVTLSPSAGFCVVKPLEVRAFKKAFVSLRLPYSVKKYEQLSVSPVIYNYDEFELQLAVHMEQTEGLCSPGSATTASYVNITLQPRSSQFVSFSAVPMKTGSIPIKIRLYDMENAWGIDAIENNLNVQTEGFEKREEETRVLKLDGKSTKTITIDGSLPDGTVPNSTSSIFVSVEGNGFGDSYARKLLSSEMVAELITLPSGCLEQTTSKLCPTVLAFRYLDLSGQWFELPPGRRDSALVQIEQGSRHITTHQRSDGSYGTLNYVPSSNWVTALIVKMLSFVVQRQSEEQRNKNNMLMEKIRQPVSYLLSIQKHDGSFSDPNPVLHRENLKDKDQDASMTAFITLALYRSLEFLQAEVRSKAEQSISRSTSYLLSHLEELQHPYAVAITAYCLSVSLPNTTDHSRTWAKLEAIKGEDDKGYYWAANVKKKVEAITVEATAYTLLTAVQLGHMKVAEKTASWLNAQENYYGGFKSTQDTLVGLEALAEYELKRPFSPEPKLKAEFTSKGRNEMLTLELENKKERVETSLKKFTGNNITVHMSGKGDIKFKIVKAYHLLEPKDDCDQLSISVRVEGKVKYTAKIIENYEYYDYDTDEDKQDQEEVPRSAIEGSGAHTRNRRDLDNNLSSSEAVTYTVCVSKKSGLTGMAIADIILLSGFEAKTADLDKLKESPEHYIDHYETSFGRVLIYFNEIRRDEECISFDAKQLVPVGLVQPAQASFYDYYEPDRKCTVFYSAPQRSRMVSKLCSEDVCECAERPCHKLQETFSQRRKIRKINRVQHACFFPVVDYAYIVEVSSVSVKSNFELYKTNITDVLKSHNDDSVRENPVRVFAKRVHCKGKLDVGKHYLIMGKDGTTKDSNGMMQYLLESNTWVEKKPSEECRKSANRLACREFNQFVDEYKVDGCRV